MTPVTVEIVATRGSAPRDAGTAMTVSAEGITGTIGGGALEYQAIATARAAQPGALPFEQSVPLGPGLGQCCGGSVVLRFSYTARLADVHPFAVRPAVPKLWQRKPLWVWGAGHVGRAMMRVITPLEAFDLTWVDTAPERFPTDVPLGITVAPTADLPALMPYAPQSAAHLIFTYAHDFDLALCHAALQRGFGFCGLIGSDTKWARFRSRLSALGHSDATIARITCPIGDKSLGKHPDAIAAGVAAQLLMPAVERGTQP